MPILVSLEEESGTGVEERAEQSRGAKEPTHWSAVSPTWANVVSHDARLLLDHRLRRSLPADWQTGSLNYTML